MILEWTQFDSSTQSSTEAFQTIQLSELLTTTEMQEAPSKKRKASIDHPQYPHADKEIKRQQGDDKTNQQLVFALMDLKCVVIWYLILPIPNHE